jgi:hypothetical protein
VSHNFAAGHKRQHTLQSFAHSILHKINAFNKPLVSFFFVARAILQPSLSVNSQPTEELHLHGQYYFYDPGISS